MKVEERRRSAFELELYKNVSRAMLQLAKKLENIGKPIVGVPTLDH